MSRKVGSVIATIITAVSVHYVYAFNNRVQLVQDFTSLPEAHLNRVTFIKAKGSTALFDATYAAVEKVREGRHHKKVILIFSDGEENSSRYSGRELRNLLRENDVQIYAIGMSEISSGAGTLKFISEPTGGQALFPFDYASAEVVYTRLALMLRRQYVISSADGDCWLVAGRGNRHCA